MDFFYLKGIIEDLFDKLSIKNYQIKKPNTELKGLHPGVSASVVLGRDEVGIIGKIHPDYEKKYEVKNVFVFEISLTKLFESSHKMKSVKEISKYPTIDRDLALVMDKSVTARELEENIRRAVRKNLNDVKIFDLYEDESLGANKKQIAVSISFGDNTRTLEAKEVDDAIEAILTKLQSLGITIRQ